MKAWSATSMGLAATARDWRCASSKNAGERTSGTQTGTGRRPCERNRCRCSRTFSRLGLASDVRAMTTFPLVTGNHTAPAISFRPHSPDAPVRSLERPSLVVNHYFLGVQGPTSTLRESIRKADPKHTGDCVHLSGQPDRSTATISNVTPKCHTSVNALTGNGRYRPKIPGVQRRSIDLTAPRQRM